MGVATASSMAGSSTYPADVTYAQGGLERNRITVFFRGLLIIPIYVMVAIFGIGFEITSLIAWFAILFTGRYPDGMYSFGVSYMRLTANFYAYAHYITDEYPPWTGNDAKATAYPVQYSIVYPGQSNRVTVFFRGLLAIPAVIFGLVVAIGSYICALLAWFAILFTGRYPEGLLSFNQNAIRCYMRIHSYYWFMTDEYPPFSLL